MAAIGNQSAQQVISENKAPCIDFKVRVIRRITAGMSEVEVVTECRVNVFGLSILGIQSPHLSGRSREVIDVYRHP
jgi:hypothetical protein